MLYTSFFSQLECVLSFFSKVIYTGEYFHQCFFGLKLGKLGRILFLNVNLSSFAILLEEFAKYFYIRKIDKNQLILMNPISDFLFPNL